MNKLNHELMMAGYLSDKIQKRVSTNTCKNLKDFQKTEILMWSNRSICDDRPKVRQDVKVKAPGLANDKFVDQNCNVYSQSVKTHKS